MPVAIEHSVVIGSSVDLVLELVNEDDGTPVTADTTPTITVEDPKGNEFVASTNMTFESLGIHIYTFSTTSGTDRLGFYKAAATALVGGVTHRVTFNFEVIS